MNWTSEHKPYALVRIGVHTIGEVADWHWACAVQELSKEYIERQKTVDEALVKALSPELKGYLGARFTLKAGDRPHLMKF